MKISNPLVCLADCKEALSYLSETNSAKPGIILTDFNTPQMDAIEFLKVIKADHVLRQIPIIILSGSDDENDVIESSKLGAAGYMVKPTDYKNVVEMVRTIHNYWNLSESPVRSMDSQSDHTASLIAAVKR